MAEKEYYPFRISPQMRLINALQTLQIPLAKPEKYLKLIITYMDIVNFSEQAEQDLICYVKIGSRSIFQSGFVSATGLDLPKPTSETRSSARAGLPYDRLSSTSSAGFPDNLLFGEKQLPYVVKSNEVVYFEIKNQSSVYKHGVIVDLQGVFVRGTEE
jgi:hypothetical protein